MDIGIDGTHAKISFYPYTHTFTGVPNRKHSYAQKTRKYCVIGLSLRLSK